MDMLKNIETMTIEIMRIQGTLKVNKNFKIEKTVVNDNKAKLKLLNKLSAEYTDVEVEVFQFISEASNTSKKLEEISLGKSALNGVAYIKNLIKSEMKNTRSGSYSVN
jgi:hypothetical protein